nr:disease resistance protein (TIR-NBS-LRR class) family [Tanacetum cinerariifolium]
MVSGGLCILGYKLNFQNDHNSGFDEKLVGMETQVRDAISSLEIGIVEVRMTEIKGMRGAGKTTTVRGVYDHLYNHFEAKSFAGSLRKASMLRLKNSQEQVLSNVLNEQVTLDSIDDGKNMMKKRICGKKVLLVLDDVDHKDHLKALAGEHKWFKPGIRVLITTRDEKVLEAHTLNVIRGKDKLEWADTIKRLKKSPLKETQESLELSYMSPDYDD